MTLAELRQIITGDDDDNPLGKGCPHQYGIIGEDCHLACSECWTLDVNKRDALFTAIRIIHGICMDYEDCEECPINGKCLLVDPTTWDMKNYKKED